MGRPCSRAAGGLWAAQTSRRVRGNLEEMPRMRDLRGSPGDSAVKNPPTTLETQVPSLGQEDPLEKGMATHSSILASEIPRSEEPGGLQSMESQKSQMWLSCYIKTIKWFKWLRAWLLSESVGLCLFTCALFPPNKHFIHFTTFHFFIKIHVYQIHGPGPRHRPLALVV